MGMGVATSPGLIIKNQKSVKNLESPHLRTAEWVARGEGVGPGWGADRDGHGGDGAGKAQRCQASFQDPLTVTLTLTLTHLISQKKTTFFPGNSRQNLHTDGEEVRRVEKKPAHFPPARVGQGLGRGAQLHPPGLAHGVGVGVGTGGVGEAAALLHRDQQHPGQAAGARAEMAQRSARRRPHDTPYQPKIDRKLSNKFTAKD